MAEPAAAARRSQRAEIEAAFGVLHDDTAWIQREGVLWHEPSQCDLLFITLRNSEALFSPSTRYRDLALGPTEPFVCLGFARYESHEGERIWFVPEWRFAGGWSARSRRRG